MMYLGREVTKKYYYFRLLFNIHIFNTNQLIKMKRILCFGLMLLPGFLFEHAKAQVANFSYAQTCYGNQTTLVASSTLPDASISSWQWDLDGNGSYEMSGKTIISLFTSNDTLAIKLKVTPVAGTADSITKNVIIDPLPQVNFMANNLCESRSATYISQSTIAYGTINQFLWDFNNDGQTDDASNDTVNYTVGPPQTYITKLTCVSDKGCSAFTQKTTTVYPSPVAAFTTANTCLGDNTLFTNSTLVPNPDYYTWDFGDGSGNVSSGNTGHTYQLAGNYNVQLIAVSQAGCRDTLSSSITINPKPTAMLQFSGDTILFEGGSVTISVVGGSFNYTWSTGDVADNITVITAGSYSVHVTDANGCSVDLLANVGVQDIPDTVAVSGFILTPNDDNINDALIIQNISAYENCDLKIYSMWNDEVFSISGYKNDWKGTNASGGALTAGAYYYVVKCDEKPLLKGNINILR
jgi:gliding motility-associated-like protein